MRKLIAAMNITIDGYCDHTVGIADAALHLHYADLLDSGDAILYGRITYQLMEYWQPLVANPTGDRAMDVFAVTMDRIPKIVFSHTLKSLNWESARLADRSLEEEVVELKKQSGRDFFVGSPGLINSLTKLRLIDEYQLCVHPVIAGSGLRLFHGIEEARILKLVKTKTFESGCVLHYYVPT